MHLPLVLTCGCRMPFEDHGDPRNIVERALVNAGTTKELKNAGRAGPQDGSAIRRVAIAAFM